jgi:hypothetical protein
VDEFDDGGVEDRAIALVTAQPGSHEQHCRPHPFSAARLDIPANLWNDRNLRLDVANELAIHELEVAANGLEDLRKGGCFFHALLRLKLYHGLKRR